MALDALVCGTVASSAKQRLMISLFLITLNWRRRREAGEHVKVTPAEAPSLAKSETAYVLTLSAACG